MEKKKNLFEIAKENAKYKECNGCHQVKPIDSFKKGNKYCTGCPYVVELREKYRNQNIEINNITSSEIEDIDLDEFFKD